MNRLTAATLLTAALAATATPAAAAQHCRPHAGEHQLARSGQAVVLERLAQPDGASPRQTITGCSRRSGKRREIATLRRSGADDRTKLVGLRLAGTRVAYAMTEADGVPTLVADDAVHGGRRHDLGRGGWPFGPWSRSRGVAVSWAVDAQGDVAWRTTAGAQQAVGVWRPGLGRRQVDSHAVLGDVTVRDGVLRWRRNGASRSVDLASVPASRCGALSAAGGTLEIDVARPTGEGTVTACLRATGRTVRGDVPIDAHLLDANGPYLLLGSMHAEIYIIQVLDLVNATDAQLLWTGPEAVVDERGSIAWRNDALWVRDAAGTRRVADVPAGSGPLLRDGATVTVGGGGPSVTLEP